MRPAVLSVPRAWLAHVLLVLLLLAPPALLSAQGPPPGTPPGKPISDAEVATALVTLRQLDSTVRKHPHDADAWYRLGMVAWALMYRDRVGPPYKGVDWTMLGRQADSALRLASSLDPANARYLLSKGQFFLGTGPITMRVQAYPMFGSSLRNARKMKDPAFHAEAAIEVGRLHWRRYDDLANRRVWNEGTTGRSIESIKLAAENVGAVSKRAYWAKAINSISTQLPFDLNGESDYHEAEALFREAYEVQPNDPRVFREMAMVFAERKRWSELAALARDRITRLPNDGNAWLALGLAFHRGVNRAAAEATFDSALARLGPGESTYIMNLTRVMAPQDTEAYHALTTDERAQHDRFYWFLHDPLWSRGGNEARAEFLARAAFADLRWTVEELGVRGLDSDRGEMHVRFGPPDVEAQIGPADVNNFESSEVTDQRPAVVTAWGYDAGWLIVFRGSPTYATAMLPPEDGRTIDSLVRARPSDWRNSADVVANDMRTQVARFRSAHDSIDVYMAVEPPVDEIREAVGANSAIRADLWLLHANGSTAVRDSATLKAATAQAWTYRVAPGRYAYRVEATAEGATIGGRSADWITTSTERGYDGFTRSGFGISDPLLTKTAVERGPVRSWHDLLITPTAGTVAAGSQISVVWENYDLHDSSGTAAYTVAMTVQRQYKAVLNRIRARIINSFATMVGVERTEDRVVYRFQRQQAYAPTVVDHLEIDLADTPAGDYLFKLEITDHVTGKVAERSTRFTIRE